MQAVAGMPVAACSRTGRLRRCHLGTTARQCCWPSPSARLQRTPCKWRWSALPRCGWLPAPAGAPPAAPQGLTHPAPSLALSCCTGWLSATCQPLCRWRAGTGTSRRRPAGVPLLALAALWTVRWWMGAGGCFQHAAGVVSPSAPPCCSPDMPNTHTRPPPRLQTWPALTAACLGWAPARRRSWTPSSACCWKRCTRRLQGRLMLLLPLLLHPTAALPCPEAVTRGCSWGLHTQSGASCSRLRGCRSPLTPPAAAGSACCQVRVAPTTCLPRPSPLRPPSAPTTHRNATTWCTGASAGRVSYAFGFTGPSTVTDTACSSSLVAMSSAHSSLMVRWGWVDGSCRAFRRRRACCCDLGRARLTNQPLSPARWVYARRRSPRASTSCFTQQPLTCSTRQVRSPGSCLIDCPPVLRAHRLAVHIVSPSKPAPHTLPACPCSPLPDLTLRHARPRWAVQDPGCRC